MKYLVMLGRILFAAIFIMAAPNHFKAAEVGYAAAHNVPFPELLVPVSGVIALLGGLSIATGFKAKWGGWLIVLFLVPVTLMMHNFWAETDPKAMGMQEIMFMKNMAMLGGALLIAHFGAGPMSVDNGRG